MEKIVILTLVAVIWFVFAGVVCNVSPETAERVLQNHGLQEVRLKGHAYLACSDSDSFSSKFEATNSKGERVSGVICCGYFKSCTVRY